MNKYTEVEQQQLLDVVQISGDEGYRKFVLTIYDMIPSMPAYNSMDLRHGQNLANPILETSELTPKPSGR